MLIVGGEAIGGGFAGRHWEATGEHSSGRLRLDNCESSANLP